MSSLFTYFEEGITDTYNQTVDYWGKDGSLADSVDVLTWSANNPDIVVTATKKGVIQSADELSTAINQDTNKLIMLVIAGLGAYIYLQKKVFKW